MIFPCQKPIDYKIDAWYIDSDYRRNWGYYHTGLDINGKGGGNTDLGKPVYCIYKGIVTDAGVGSGAWGNIVRVWHPTLNVYSRYAHLNTINVEVGQALREGDFLGGIGRGKNNAYIAHLHFDIMLNRKLRFDHWIRKGEAGKKDVLNFYLNPEKLFFKFGVEYYV